MKVVVTGGGTGGHIYPALAVAAALREAEPGLQLLYGGRGGGLEERLAGEAGVPFLPLPGRPVSGSGAAKALLSLAGGVQQARRLLAREQPDIVIGTGGYASTALTAAQATRRKPLAILEGNAIPGRTNRMLAPACSIVFTAFNSSVHYFPQGRCVVTGFPIRRSLLSRRDRAAARQALGLDPEAFTLLVVGGSQGAKAFNDLVLASAERLTAQGVQIVHQLGAKNADFQAPEIPLWRRLAYIEDMPSAYAAADVVLARGGASTLSELAAQGACAILVPYPFAQADHQTANAMEVASEGRALCVPQSELSPELFKDMILDLKANPEKRRALSDGLRLWSRPWAAQQVAETALAVARGEYNALGNTRSSEGAAI